MLSELHISNFALIEDQSVSFEGGLNVISGETGSGKSILLQAIQFLLGARQKNQIIRNGAEEAHVEGSFNLERLSERVFNELPDLARTRELSLGRSISRSGKSKIYINGRLASLSALEDVAEKLVNVCSQNQHVRLLEPRYHLELVDNYAGNAAVLEGYQKAFAAWRERTGALEDLKKRSSFAASRRAELELCIAELEAANIRPGCRAELEAEVKRLAGAEKLIAEGQAVVEALSGEGGLHGQLQRVSLQMQELAKLDKSLVPLAGSLSSARTEVREFEAEFSRYLSKISVDESGLQALRDRLAEVARLERKYRLSEAGLNELLENARRELNELEGGLPLGALENEVAALFEQVRQISSRLSAARASAGKKLARDVKHELSELNMADCSLQLALSSVEYGSQGADRGEILISTNKGEPQKALREIASGGELSRIMLVLKKILRDQTGVNVLIFDEVDTGVSGGVARAVGEKLRGLSRYSQVICITHLPQVASLADHHLLVDKQVGERAVTVIREIKGEERVNEIARMLAGFKVTAAARESARELISSAR